MASQYHYKALPGRDGIRLLKLHLRESLSDPIRATLEVVQLGSESCPSYEALSWCWGTEDRTEEIECSDHLVEFSRFGQKLKVTKDLYRALKTLSGRGPGHRTLWVDAICINQDDVKEVNSQVSLMHRIYQSAENVVVWLGEPENTPVASDSSETWLRHLVDEHQLASKATPPSLDTQILQSLSSPWFRRVWVVQEIILAKRVMMVPGTSGGELSWESFWQEALRMVSHPSQFKHNSTKFTPFPEFPLGLYTLVSTSTTIPFLRRHAVPEHLVSDFGLRHTAAAEFKNILKFSAKCGVTDSRDWVFAIIGLAEPLGIKLPKPDYSKSVEVVFREASIAALGMHKVNTHYQAHDVLFALTISLIR